MYVCSQDLDVAEELIEEWFDMVQENSKIVRKESSLVYELRDLELIEQHEDLDREIRKRLSKDGKQACIQGGMQGDRHRGSSIQEGRHRGSSKQGGSQAWIQHVTCTYRLLLWWQVVLKCSSGCRRSESII